VRTALEPGQALVEYVRFQPIDFTINMFLPAHYAVFILAGGGPISRIDLGDAKEIDDLIDKLRGGQSEIQRFIDANGASLSTEQIALSEKALVSAAVLLRDRVWKPIELLLPKGTRVYIGAEGQLGLVPFRDFANRECRRCLQVSSRTTRNRLRRNRT
jgi:hypothetical protein